MPVHAIRTLRTTAFCILLMLCFGVSVKAQNAVDSLQQLLHQQKNQDSLYAMTCWYLAQYYDDHNQFDSMQHWLNVGVERLPVNKTQFIHFNYAAFQSIAYYYNGLLQMDLYESIKVLDLAKALNDSVLLTTGYNFVGLANSNIAQYQTAIPYFYDGMKYARQPPFGPKYHVASKPHHLYGNLAEVYYKMNQLDSAQVNVLKSIQLATAIQSRRGVAVGKNLLGLILTKLNSFDSALQVQTQSYQEGIQFNEPDVSLVATAAIARIYQLQMNESGMRQWLNKGFDLKQKNPEINYYFTRQFLEEALDLYEQTNNLSGRLKCLEWIEKNNERINRVTDQQIVKIIQNRIKSEQRANQSALRELEQARRLASLRFLLAILVLSALGLVVFIYFVNNKRTLRELKLRQEMSRDLHDDINATLSSIKLYSELSIQEQQKQNPLALSITKRISELSGELMGRVSDVIYLLKSEAYTGEAFNQRMKVVAHDILKARDIQAIFRFQSEALRHIVSPLERKNALLILKEALNNVVKYSEASQCHIRLYEQQEFCVLEIEDNGIGFPNEKSGDGNGLQNMRFRTEQMRGQCQIKTGSLGGVLIQCTWRPS